MDKDKSAVKKGYSIRSISFGKSRAYLFEYGLLLALVVALINILGMMLQELIGKQASFIQNGFFLPYFGGYGYGDMTVGLLAGFIVVFPAVVVLIQRTAAAERVDADIKNLAWRKGILNIFLAIACVWAIVSLVSVITAGLNYLSLNDVLGTGFDWREAVENLAKATFLLLAVWAFSGDYRNVVSSKTSKAMHIFRYSIVVLSLVAGVLFVIFPFMNNRNQAVDSQISGDLFTMQSEITSKHYQNSALPESLSELSLDDKVKERINKHSYIYEKLADDKYKLCATFLTKSDGQFGVYPALEKSIYPQYNGDFYNHPKGQKCFEQNVTGIFTTEPIPPRDKGVTEPAVVDTLEAPLDSEITPTELR